MWCCGRWFCYGCGCCGAGDDDLFLSVCLVSGPALPSLVLLISLVSLLWSWWCRCGVDGGGGSSLSSAQFMMLYFFYRAVVVVGAVAVRLFVVEVVVRTYVYCLT